MNFSEQSRVWIYQADREFSDTESSLIKKQLDNFTVSWTAHNHLLKAKAEIRYNRFIVLIVDESQAGASGCSIDKSVNFIKQLENAYNLNLLNRLNMAYREENDVLSASRDEFEVLIKTGKITTETVVFNNLVQSLSELRNKWEVPFKESWHMQLFGNLVK